MPGADVKDLWEGISQLVTEHPTAHVRVTTVDILPQAEVVEPYATTLLAAASPAKGERKFGLRWNVQGHAVVARLASEVLENENPAVYARLIELMNSDPLVRSKTADGMEPIGAYAQWPDRIKGPSRNDPANIRDFAKLGLEHKPDHYVNYPYSPGVSDKRTPEAPIGTGNLLPALEEWKVKLTSEKDPTARCTALAFILHLVGDIHQPLHCTAMINDKWFNGDDGDQGGNLVWWGSSLTLHGYWDNLLARKSDDVEKSFAALKNQLDRAEFAKELKLKTFKEWSFESYAVAVAEAYDKLLAASAYLGKATRVDHRSGAEHEGALFEAPKSEYQRNAKAVAERQARLAAHRLADVLAECLT